MTNKGLTVLLTLCIGTFIGSTAFGQDASTKDLMKELQELKKTNQVVLDKQEIENLMGIRALQIKGSAKPGDAGYRETAAQAKDVCYGEDDNYVYGDAARKALRGQDDPAFGKAGTLKMHMVTTSNIQIADDGKTAKGIFYSPGYLTEIGTDGKAKAAWDYKRLGVDFIKEDGKWKIWHFIAYTEFVTPPNVSWTDKSSVTNTNIKYQTWSPETGAEKKLKGPVAYKTFSETFSYCPAEGSKK